MSELQALLAERPRVLGLISSELAELKEKFATPRRTEIEEDEYAELDESDLTTREQVILIRSARGFVKRMQLGEFEAQGRGTRGKAGMANLRDDDAVRQAYSCSSHDTVLAISERGIAYALPAYRVPETSRAARGVLMHELLPIGADEDVAELLPVADFTDELYLVLLTRHGWIKRTALSAFSKITARGLLCASLAEGDRVVRAAICSASDSVPRPRNHAPQPHNPLASSGCCRTWQVILASKGGSALRFSTNEKQLRASGRASRGVKSMQARWITAGFRECE